MPLGNEGLQYSDRPDSCSIVWRDKSMPKGWLYNWVGMARRRK